MRSELLKTEYFRVRHLHHPDRPGWEFAGANFLHRPVAPTLDAAGKLYGGWS